MYKIKKIILSVIFLFCSILSFFCCSMEKIERPEFRYVNDDKSKFTQQNNLNFDNLNIENANIEIKHDQSSSSFFSKFSFSGIYNGITSISKNYLKKTLTSTKAGSFADKIWENANFLGNTFYDHSARFRNLTNKSFTFAKDNAIKLGISSLGLVLAGLGIKKIIEQDNNTKNKISRLINAISADPKLQLLIIGGIVCAGYAGYKWYKNNQDKIPDEKKIKKVNLKNEIEKIWRNKLKDFLSNKITYEQYSDCLSFYELFVNDGTNNPKLYKENKKIWNILTTDQKIELDEIIYFYDEYLKL